MSLNPRALARAFVAGRQTDDRLMSGSSHRLLPYLVGVIVLVGSSLRADNEDPTADTAKEGPAAALAFEKSFRDAANYWNSGPIQLEQCTTITELSPKLWSKKQVLRDFKKHRSPDQVGVIVIVKTEYCCGGSRLCAVTTASLEKKSTPLVDRFRVYAGWVRDNPNHAYEEWGSWEEDVIREYDFVQGPGARVVVMVPTWDGKMYQWYRTATDLELSQWEFESRGGETPALDRFLSTAIKLAPPPPERSPEATDQVGE